MWERSAGMRDVEGEGGEEEEEEWKRDASRDP